MTRDEAVAQIQMFLAFRSDLAAEIITQLKASQVELEEAPFLPWFLISEVASAVTVIGEERVPIPTDFIRLIDDEPLFYFDSTAILTEQWRPIELADTGTLIAAYQSSVGAPEAFVLDNAYFRLKPIPDAVYTLKMKYYHKDVVLSTNVENLWLEHAHELLIGKAGQKMGLAVRDAQAMQAFVSMEGNGMKSLVESTTAREEAGKVRQMGGVD